MARPTSIPAPARLLVLALAAAALTLIAPIHDGTPTADAQTTTYRHVDLTLVDTLGGAVTGVAVDAGTGVAYVSRGARVEALDVSSDPTGPTLLATSERLTGVARVLGAAGERVFVAVRNTAQDGTTSETLMVLATADLAAKALPVAGEIAVSAKEPPSSGRIAWIERAFASDASTAYLVATAEPRVVKVIDLRAWPSTSEAHVTLAADINGIAIAGATLVAATDGGVTTIDAGDPSAPVVRGELALPWGAGGVAVDGATAYALTIEGLASLDISDVAHLALRGPLNANCGHGRRATLAVAGGRVWVADRTDAPYPTEKVTFCALSRVDGVGSGVAHALDVRGIASAGDTIYIAAQRFGLVSLTSEPPPEFIVSGWNLPALGDLGGLSVTGGVARAMDADSELWTFDATNAAAPSLLGRSALWPPTANRQGDIAAGLAVRDDVAFQAFVGGGGNRGSMAAIALAPLAQPSVLGQWRHSDVPAERRSFDWREEYPTSVYGLYLSGNTLFLTGESVALTALDVANPAAPRWLGRFTGPDWEYTAGGLALDGKRAWLALYGDGVGLLDVSDPTAPWLIDRIALPGSTRDVARIGGFVLAATVEWWRPPGSDDRPPADGRGNLVVIDAATHRIVAQLPGDVPGHRLVVDGTHAFVYGEGEIEVVDVRDPMRPIEVGRVRTGVPNSRDVPPLAVVSDTLWAGTGDLGVSIYRLAEGASFTPPPPFIARAYLPYGLTARP